MTVHKRVSFRERAPHEMANIGVGIKGLSMYLNEGHDAILLCGCSHYQQCHLHTIIEHDVFKAALPDVQVVVPGSSRIEGFTACLSIQQPWSWLILHEEVLQSLDIQPKTLEDRGWTTGYRGPLLLHAGKGVDTTLFKGSVLSDACWIALFGREAGSQLSAQMPKGKDDYERGIIGCCTLVDVVEWSESPWYCPDQYGFVLSDIRPLPESRAYAGKQGIFYVPDASAL